MNLKEIETKEEFLALKPEDRFLIQLGASGQFLMGCGNGSTRDEAEAHLYALGEEFYYEIIIETAEAAWRNRVKGYKFMLVVPIDPSKPVPIECIFNANQIALMKQAPRADAVKGFVLQKVHKLPPAEIATYEQLKDWVEASYKGKAAVSPRPSNPNSPTSAIRVEFDWTGKIYGTCHYSCHYNGITEETYSVEALADLAAGVESFQDLLNKLIENERDNHSEDEVMKATGENEYSGYECGDESLNDVVVSTSKSSQLKAFLRANLPEVAERLGINE